MHESQATIQLQHTRMFYCPILTIASQSFDCDRYGNLHYYHGKIVDLAKQSKEHVNKLSNCHFVAPILRKILNNGVDDYNHTKLTLLTYQKN